ncbi:MAG: hypothetical protein QM743_01580 [Chitinophagaceae bacterium]
MIKKLLSGLCVFGSCLGTARAQNTYLQLGEDEYHLLDRLETKSGKLSGKLFLSTKPVTRAATVSFLEDRLDEANNELSGISLNKVDRYNMYHAIAISSEWRKVQSGENEIAVLRAKPWFGTFYKTGADFVYVNTKDFFLSVNPVISAQYMSEQSKSGGVSSNQGLFASSRGAEIRARIADKIGLYTYFADNQEQPPTYVTQWITRHSAVPGADYYQNSPGSKTYDYIQARGYIDFAAIKNYVNVTFGYDKQFLGDGIRSLFLSDFAASSTFLKLNTKIWKLNYQNIYAEIIPPYVRGADRNLPLKYTTTHYLTVNATKWLNVGLFESIVFSKNSYSFGYLNPIIFYRAIERFYGSPDNVNLGFSLKVIPLKGVQLYSQLFLDEFKSKELFGSNKWWGNKYGLQLGAKYFDAFTVRNLDLQGEFNLVRPYTYSHSDSVTNYSHYNQPLAHPLGSGFREIIVVANYRPVQRLSLTGKLMYYKQGVDTGGLNYGNDIFRSYNSVVNQYGVTVINGLAATCKLASFNASYKIAERLFFDLGFIYRNYQYQNNYYPQQQSLSIYGGMRLNIARRTYDFM